MVDAEARADGHRVAGLEAARAAFYEGEIAEKIARYHEENGGYLTREDLASFRCKVEPPVSTRWRDLDVLTCDAWCQGPMLPEALLILEAAGLESSGLEHNSPDYIHLVVEALKAVFSDREHHYGDPDFVDVQLARLLSGEHAAARAAAIDMERAMTGLPDPLFGEAQPLPRASDAMAPSHIGEGGAPVLPNDAPAGEREPKEGGTSYVCVVDRWGNSFSATPSDGASTSPVIPGLGIVPSLRGLQSRPDPSHPSGVAPGKRPRLTPNPAIAVADDGRAIPFGCPGGDMQVQAMLQVLVNHVHFGFDLQQSVNAPRFSTWSFPNSFAPVRVPARPPPARGPLPRVHLQGPGAPRPRGQQMARVHPRRGLGRGDRQRPERRLRLRRRRPRAKPAQRDRLLGRARPDERSHLIEFAEIVG